MGCGIQTGGGTAERFHRLIQTVPHLAIQGYLMDGTVIFWNEASERLYGYTSAEAMGRNLLDLIIPPGMRDAVREHIAGMARTGESVPAGELQLQRKDGTLVPVYSGHAVIAMQGHPTQFFCMDVDLSAMKLLEQERERLRDQLAQVQKLESVGRLAGGIAHDFNNMLGVIIGHADLALERVPASAPVADDLREIRHAAQRSVDLTSQLLAYARRQIATPRTLDLNEAIDGSLKLLGRLIGEDIELKRKASPDLWPVRIDPVQVDQILTNLCANARDAIDGPGIIEIETTNVRIEARDCSGIPDCVPGEYARVSVRDTGCGMSRDVLDRIFEPFFTTKSPGRGTGLGLSTVHGIVRQNGGFIDVHSRPGAGTTITILLPRTSGADAEVNGMAPDPPGRRGGTVLVVEDEPALLNLCASYLRGAGYTVLTAATAAEALVIADAGHVRFDALLTDIVMPGMDGRTLARVLSARIPELRCILMSGYNRPAPSGDAEPCSAFIRKPFSRADLIRAIDTALRPA